MTNPSPNATPDLACPLACDAEGNPVALPEGASAWRVRRHTGGRPRIQLGVDKQPMQLPLTYTLADLDDILPPAVYRLDLVDSNGEPLGMTKQINLGQLRNAGASEAESDDEPTLHALSTTTASSSVSDTRFVLEANVRTTQLAFEHNRQTLELGLRMAETLRDGVHVLADAQADWIKSIASSRGFFRNAPPPLLPAPPESPKRDADDEDEEDDDDEANAPAGPQDWVEKLGPIVAIVAQQVMTTLAARFSGAAPAGGAKPGMKFELADMFNWKRAHERATESRAEKPAALPPTAAATMNPAELLGVLPPAVLQKLMQVRGLLSADEQQRAMQLIGALDAADVPALVAHLQPMPAEQVAEFLRAQIAKPAA